MTWDPAQYERFKAERTRPFFDLLSLVRPAPGLRAVDLGCGTGELTREMHRRLGCARTVGYDNSAAMLAKSASFAEPGLTFESADVAALELPSKSVDLVLSNAALQWVPAHREVLARSAGWLSARGQVAVQMPANHDHPAHATARDLAGEAPFAGALGDYTHHQDNVRTLTEYAELLYALGFREQRVRVEVYAHVLASREDVVEWMKGSGLTAYRERLGELYPRFLDAYRARLVPLLSEARPYFFPFKRLLLWGERPA